MPGVVVDTLLEVAPVFSGCSEAERSELWKVALEARFQPGDTITEAGKTSSKFYVLAQGTVEVLEDGGGTLATLIPPCSFGEIAFFRGAPHQVTTKALTQVHLLAIDHTRFDKLMKNGSTAALKVAHNVLLVLGGRLREIDRWVTEKIQKDPTLSASWQEFRSKIYQEWEF